MKLSFAEFKSWYMDQLLTQALEDKNVQTIKQIMSGQIEIKILAFGQEIIISPEASPRARSRSSVTRFNLGDQVKWGNNEGVYEVLPEGLRSLTTGEILKASHASMYEMAVEQNVTLEFLKGKYPAGVAGLSHPKWHLV